MAALSPYLTTGVAAGKKIEEALAGQLVCEQGLRILNNPQLLGFRTTRKSAKGMLIKAHVLVYQLTHASTINAALVTADLEAANLTVVASPLTQDGVGHLNAQARNGNVFFIHPTDVSSPADRTCATMLATAGPVLEVPAGDAASVVDTIVWPQTPAYLVSTREAGAVPPFQDVVPTAEAFMAFLSKYVANHSLEEEFHAAAIEAAAIVGATWVITVDAPLAALDVPYLEIQPPLAFDTVLELPEDDPRLAGEEPWPQHPQAAQGIRY